MTERFAGLLKGRKIAVANTTHLCVGFESIEEAERQIAYCAGLGRNAIWSGGKCTVHDVVGIDSLIKQCPHFDTPFHATCPFGTRSGEVDRRITVITPMRWYGEDGK